jgi:drug/metabolite transporter (DMT)-like permease
LPVDVPDFLKQSKTPFYNRLPVPEEYAGIFHMVLASLVLASMGGFVKILGKRLDPIEVVFFRNLVGVAFIGFSLLGKPIKNPGGKPGLLIFRGIAGTLSLYALFYNMANIGLGVAVTYLQTSPIFIAILAFAFLREKISKVGWLAVLIGFGGILLVFRPEMNFTLKTHILGIFNGFAAATAYTAIRDLKKYYDTRTIVLSFMIAGIILPVISMLIGSHWKAAGLDFLLAEFRWPIGIEWFWLLLVGITAMIGQLLMTKAYGEEKAGVVSTIGYINIPFALFIGILLGDPFPEVLTAAGILLIVASGVIISLRRNI